MSLVVAEEKYEVNDVVTRPSARALCLNLPVSNRNATSFGLRFAFLLDSLKVLPWDARTRSVYGTLCELLCI